MVYNIKYSNKLQFPFHILSCILVLSYIITLSSCMTADITYVTPEAVEPSNFSDVSLIVLKNRMTIDCRNKAVNFEKGNDSVFYFTLLNKVPGDEYKTYGEKQLIPANDILKIQLSGSRLGGGGIGLIIVGVAVVGILIAAVIASNMNFGH